jgi:protein-tyrosine phosphatase
MSVASALPYITSSYCPGNYIGHNIILGSLMAYKTPRFFQDCEVAHVISLKPIPTDVHKLLVSQGVKVDVFNIPHREFHDEFSTLLKHAYKVVRLAKLTNSIVFINCRSGQHRSVALCCALLMLFDGVSYWDAFNHIHSHRPCAEPVYEVKEYVSTNVSSKNCLSVDDLYIGH